MSLTTAAVQHDFYRLCVDRNLLSSLDVGRLRHIDAGRLIVNILGDTETDPRFYKTRIHEFLRPYHTVDVNETDFSLPLLTTVTEHFCGIALSADDIAQVHRRVRSERGSQSSHAKPGPGKQKQMRQFSDAIVSPVQPVPNARRPRHAVRPSQLALAPIEDESAGALVQHRDAESALAAYKDYSEAELRHICVLRDDCISELKHGLAISRRKHAKTQQELEQSQDMVVALQRELDDVLSLVQFRSGRDYSNVSCFGGYSLAIARNKGHAGSSTTLDMIANDALHGFVKDKKTVIVFEHRVAAAKRLRSRDLYARTSPSAAHEAAPAEAEAEAEAEAAAAAAAEAELRDAVQPDRAPPQPAVSVAGVAVQAPEAAIPSLIEVHGYKADFTHENAVEKNSVHVSLISSIWLAYPEHKEASLDSLQCAMESTCCPGDLQSAGGLSHTGELAYTLALRELKSVGCPSWVQRCQENREDCRTVYAMCLDAGPDNKGMLRRVKEATKKNLFVMVVVLWCLLHQLHLIVKAVLVVMDNWDWPVAVQPPKKRFAGVSLFSSLWRSTGTSTTIVKAATLECGSSIAEQFFASCPSQCIRTLLAK